jgi:hypothetical protein
MSETFSPERAAEIAVAMRKHTDLTDDAIHQLGFALAEGEQAWNAAKRADQPTVTISRLGFYILLMYAASFTGMTNLKGGIDPNAN